MTVLDMYRLDGTVGIVTGASTGLGAAIATAMAEAGADVVLAARRTALLEKTRTIVEDRGRRAITVTTDITDPAQCEALVNTAITEFGRVDHLVNNAGVATAVPAVRESPEAFKAVVDVNLNGTYWMAQACARVMKPGSSIVNIGSALAMTTAGLPQAAYVASKTAVIGLTRDLAQQWTGRKGIRVNALAPGFFPTDLLAGSPENYIDSVKHRMLAGRLGDPQELAAAAVFLLSRAAGYITGATLVVDGGFSIT